MSSEVHPTKVSVELEGRDRIEVRLEGPAPRVHVRGCSELMSLMQTMRKSFGVDIDRWPVPVGSSHSEMLLRELILKLKGEWDYPYKEQEVCHCRHVSCQIIDQAIVAGAHNTATVSRLTSASTNCGTCRPDVQKMIDYRLNGGLQPVPIKKTA